ncbi:hypothetical protein AAG570_005508 [Ranatra chinensis]|uniref:Pre-mRNA-processing factor 39 n=1 Tax=Ranatra chinensis TaxID=642074 RepID=A0ABD0YAH9_9HEMI
METEHDPNTSNSVNSGDHVVSRHNAALGEKTDKYDIESPTQSEDDDKAHESALEEVSDDNDAQRKDGPEYEDKLEHDTEMVSEDELPPEGSKVPLDTEAVSDEELPGSATDMLETEAVSEDELPPEAKKKRVNHQMSDEKCEGGKQQDRSPSKNDGTSPPAKRKAADAKLQAKGKTLPELEKYWKVVKEDASDFTGWTYLLQYVDQENDVEAAREAYDTFLSHYPYCYGYWRKYADYEKRKGDRSKCEEVFERGLKAIPLSVDLWIHYLNYCKATYKDDEDHLRKQFERALETCGLEFRSDRLWESYIKWENEAKNVQNVCTIYDRLIATPTQGYTGHFENFQDFVMSNQPNKILTVDEFLTIRAEILQKLKQKTTQDMSSTAPTSSAPPGDESDEETEKSTSIADEETTLMREKIIAIRKKVFKSTVSCVLSRWNYEEGIKRPYFHVKPLERCQLNNWKDYLDYEVEQGDQQRTITLFERCLIACALYDEFWVKFVRYLESLPGDNTEKIRDVYQRACTIHHPKKPVLSLNWAIFEEGLGNIDGARKVLIRLEKEVPNLIHVASCRINLERRSGNLEEASRLYEHYISSAKNKAVSNTLSIKYARFCSKVLNDPDQGIEVLKRAIDRDKDNARLYLQVLDLILMKPQTDEAEFISVIDQFLERDSVELDFKVSFCQRKVEFLEDFGTDMKAVQEATSEYLAFLKQLKTRKRKQHEAEKAKQEDANKKKDSHGTNGQSAVQTMPPSGNSTSYSNSQSYNQSSYSQPPFNQYGQSDQNYNNYQNWGYSQPGYGNYNQGWGGYNYYS